MVKKSMPSARQRSVRKEIVYPHNAYSYNVYIYDYNDLVAQHREFPHHMYIVYVYEQRMWLFQIALADE